MKRLCILNTMVYVFPQLEGSFKDYTPPLSSTCKTQSQHLQLRSGSCCCGSSSILGFDRQISSLVYFHNNKSHVQNVALTDGFSLCPRHPIHIPGKWLQNHARVGGGKCCGAPCCMKRSFSQFFHSETTGNVKCSRFPLGDMAT